MEETKRSEDYMNMSLSSVSPEKYFDSRFDGQEKLFTEKFNNLQIQIDTLSDKLESGINNLSDKMDFGFKAHDERFKAEIKSLYAKIDGIDKRLTLGFSLIMAVLAALVALHFLK